MALTAKQERFVDEYIKCGNATEAARLAGYKGNNLNRIASENLSKLDSFIKARNGAIEDARIADMTEINEFWTSVMRDEYAETKDRLKASELRAKVQGAFIDKVQHSGSVAINNPFAELTSDELKKLVRDG